MVYFLPPKQSSQVSTHRVSSRPMVVTNVLYNYAFSDHSSPHKKGRWDDKRPSQTVIEHFPSFSAARFFLP